MNFYGLDIETDTSGGFGLDPNNGGIVDIAVATSDGHVVFDISELGSEERVIAETDAYLASLDPGVIATWNGGVFDMPFIATRASLLGVPIGLRLVADPAIIVKYETLPGHAGGYRARWGAHSHLDACQAYRDWAADSQVEWSLKPVCEHLDIPMVTVDRERIHELDDDARRDYAASDARGTRLLAERLPQSAGWADWVDTLPRLRSHRPQRTRRPPTALLVPS